MPRRQPPPGCITATEAIKLIGKSLYKYVDKGELHPQGPSTLKHKYYLASEVERIRSLEQSAFEEKINKIPASFTPALSSDMDSLYDLAVRLFGGVTISAERRKEWIAAEPKGHYVVRQDTTREVVAYLYLLSLPHDRMLQYMKECRAGNITGEEIEPLTPGKSHEVAIAGIGRDPRASKQYTAVLLHGFAQDLETWGKAGIEISRFYAYSETLDGVYLCLSMGMQQWGKPRFRDGSHCFKFVLDVQESDIPLLRPYKQALAEWRRAHGKRMPVPVQSRPERQETPVLPLPSTRTPAREKATTAPHERLTTPQEPREQELSTYASPRDLPPGTLSFQDFLSQHGLKHNRRRMLGYLERQSNGLRHEAFQSNRPNELNRYLTPEQQSALLDWLRASHPDVFKE